MLAYHKDYLYELQADIVILKNITLDVLTTLFFWDHLPKSSFRLELKAQNSFPELKFKGKMHRNFSNENDSFFENYIAQPRYYHLYHYLKSYLY